jgi:hypothetical protein
MASKDRLEGSNDKQNKAAQTWRKPLQVPPRADAMRSFYRKEDEESADDNSSKTGERENKAADETIKETRQVKKTVSKPSQAPPPEKKGREKVETKPENEQKTEKSVDKADVAEMNPTESANKLTKEELSERLGIEIEDLFDVHELLRGKSFDIYQTLTESCDENGRCKITQPELMKRTGIKNRRTFYKHEEWLINLKLLEKRHLPGDHKGVVYRILDMSDVLPLPGSMLEKFKQGLRNTR